MSSNSAQLTNSAYKNKCKSWLRPVAQFARVLHLRYYNLQYNLLYLVVQIQSFYVKLHYFYTKLHLVIHRFYRS